MVELPENERAGHGTQKKVIVIGGSGRVGGSTVRALRHLAGTQVQLLVGGRNKRNFENSVAVSAFASTLCFDVLWAPCSEG